MNYFILPGLSRAQEIGDKKVSSLIRRVCELYEISEKELRSKRQFTALVEARQICQYVMHKVYNMSSTNTGLEFGKNHSTVLYSCRNIENRMSYEKGFSNTVNNIK